MYAIRKARLIDIMQKDTKETAIGKQSKLAIAQNVFFDVIAGPNLERLFPLNSNSSE